MNQNFIVKVKTKINLQINKLINKLSKLNLTILRNQNNLKNHLTLI